MRRTSALILGGGPAGAAAAIALANGGERPLLVERTARTGDTLCGGFLSWRSLEALRAIGVEPDHLNRARVTRLRLFVGSHVVERALPAPAIGVSRHRLDTMLLDRAIQAGAAVERGVAVRRIDRGIAHLADGGSVAGAHVLLATGKHDLRGAMRDVARVADPSMGLRVRLSASPVLDRLIGQAIELHPFAGGYAGLVRQEDGTTNLCMAVRLSRLRDAGDAAALLLALGRECPTLGERLAWLPGDAAIDAVANVPYGWRTAMTQPDMYRLGDQAGVIPSLAGEGMGIAIASGRVAAHAILHGRDAIWFQRRFARALARPLGVAGMVRRLAEGPVGANMLAAAAHIPGAARMIAHLTRINTETR